MPFLTIVTRCCKRPRMLTSNIESVLSQTDRDVEQIFIVDYNQAGILRANTSLAQNKDRVDGDYVYILDDDTRLEDKDFVTKIRYITKVRHIAEPEPDVVMVKSRRPQFAPHILPKPFVWNCPERLALTSTNCLCYVVKRQLWLDHIKAFSEPAAGDWHFLKALRDSGTSFAWLDEIVAVTQQLGRGKLFEQCGKNWFQKVAQEFELAEIAPNDWRLLPHADPQRSKPKPKPERVKEVKSQEAIKQPPMVNKPVPVRRIPRARYVPPQVPIVTRVPEPVVPVPAHSLLSRRVKI